MNDNNLYLSVGIALSNIQNWENDFKSFTIKCNIEKSDDKRSLSNMNSFLLKNNYINEEEFLVIKKVIELRNYIIHRIFIIKEDENIVYNYLNQLNDKILETQKIFKLIK